MSNRVTFSSLWPARWQRYAAYLTLGLLFVLFYYYRECTTHGSDLPAFDTIMDHIKQNGWPTVMCVFLLWLTIVGIAVGSLHETCHYLAIPNRRTSATFKFRLKTFTPSIGCLVPLSKCRYIVAALMPLVVITPAAIIIYCLSDNIFIRTTALSAALLNTIGSINDVLTAKYVYSSKCFSFLEEHQFLIEYPTRPR